MLVAPIVCVSNHFTLYVCIWGADANFGDFNSKPLKAAIAQTLAIGSKFGNAGRQVVSHPPLGIGIASTIPLALRPRSTPGFKPTTLTAMSGESKRCC